MAKGSYWQSLKVNFDDGSSTSVVVDLPTYRSIVEENDQATLRKVVENCKAVGQSMDCTGTDPQADHEIEISDNSEVEHCKEDHQPYSFWSKEATNLLISLYKENESDMENPVKRKKEVWHKITKAMNDSGFFFTQGKVECKWRNLLQSHKEVRDNKKKKKNWTKKKNFSVL